jgi:acyl CoA:acetate/3-ketoacid CoA transferase alpha subunit
VKKIICSFPHGSVAGIGAFFTPTGFGTSLAEGQETRKWTGVTVWSNIQTTVRGI